MYDITEYVFDLSFHRPFFKLLSCCSRSSFLNLSRWLGDARALASPHLVTVLVGNKSDREDEREVEWSEASRWAAENGKHPTSQNNTSCKVNKY